MQNHSLLLLSKRTLLACQLQKNEEVRQIQNDKSNQMRQPELVEGLYYYWFDKLTMTLAEEIIKSNCVRMD